MGSVLRVLMMKRQESSATTCMQDEMDDADDVECGEYRYHGTSTNDCGGVYIGNRRVLPSRL
jgi:hypothetical protein